jgi:hypothetical protein
MNASQDHISSMSAADHDSKREKMQGTAADDVASAHAEMSEPVKVSFFRSTLWNTLVVGWASFLAPGIYNALASTGAGGLADVSHSELVGRMDWLMTDQHW